MILVAGAKVCDRQGQIALIDAAKAAGVRRFVLVSFNHQKAPAKCALTDAKDEAEKHLMQSGMESTILRASIFMEVWLSPALGFDAASGSATIYGTGIFEETTGRKFNVQHVPEEALQAQRNAATDPMQQSFASLMLFYGKGDPIDMLRTSKQFPIRWKSVRDYAKATTAAR